MNAEPTLIISERVPQGPIISDHGETEHCE
jgi:hypothetical protein